MILRKIKESFIKNKKKITLVSSLLICIFIGINYTFASVDGEITLIKGLNGILTIATSLIAMLTALVSLLLNPGWVNGTIFGFDIYLKDIWVLISNIVYFLFAFILIAISFMNIVGNGSGTWELKQALPKFIIGVIMVPFTWFFVQFILSISSFLTIAVLNLPHDVMKGDPSFKEFSNTNICNTYVIDLVGRKKGETEEDYKKRKKESNDKNTVKKISECSKTALQYNNSLNIGTKSLQDILSGKGSELGAVFGIMNIYTYSIMKLESITKINGITTKTVKNFTDLGIKVIIDALFMIIYLILVIALFMALFARGTWLWIYAMFSPIFGLLFFFGKANEGVGDKKFGVMGFIKLALVPVYVSAALAFGLLFMFVASKGLTDIDTSSKNSIFKLVKDDGTLITLSGNKDNNKLKNADASVISVGGFNLIMKGVVGGTSNGIIQSMGNGLGQMIIQLFGLAILWIAVMAALKSSEITGSVIEPIEQFGKSVGSLIAKAPQYAPIIPTPGGGTMGIAGLSKIGQMPKNALDARVSRKADKFKNPIYSAFGAGTPPISEEKKNEAKSLWNDGNITGDDILKVNKIYINAIKNGGKTDSQLNSDISTYVSKLSKDISKEIKSENVFKDGNLTPEAAKILLQKDKVWSNPEKSEIDKLIRDYSGSSNSSKKGSSNTSDTQTTKTNTAINIKSISGDKLEFTVGSKNISINEELITKTGKKGVKGGNQELDYVKLEREILGKIKTTTEYKNLKTDTEKNNMVRNIIDEIQKEYKKDDKQGNYNDGVSA